MIFVVDEGAFNFNIHVSTSSAAETIWLVELSQYCRSILKTSSASGDFNKYSRNNVFSTWSPFSLDSLDSLESYFNPERIKEESFEMSFCITHVTLTVV